MLCSRLETVVYKTISGANSKELCRKRSAIFHNFFDPVGEIVYLFKKQL